MNNMVCLLMKANKIVSYSSSTGPVVRITPDEIHPSDPENCEKIYHVESRLGKDPSFYGYFGADTATFTTPNQTYTG